MSNCVITAKIFFVCVISSTLTLTSLALVATDQCKATLKQTAIFRMKNKSNLPKMLAISTYSFIQHYFGYIMFAYSSFVLLSISASSCLFFMAFSLALLCLSAITASPSMRRFFFSLLRATTSSSAVSTPKIGCLFSVFDASAFSS